MKLDRTTQLFATAQFSEDDEAARAAKDELLASGKPALVALLKKPLKLSSEAAVAKFVKASCTKATGLDPVGFVCAMVTFEQHRGSDGVAVGLKWLLEHGDAAAKVHGLRCSTLDGTSLELCGFGDIPAEVGELTELEELHLSRNKAKTLPASLGKLKKLQKLSLDENQLTSLPDSLGALTNLTSLDLRRNKLTTLPASLAKLTKLTYLGLSKNKLTAFPSFVAKLKALKELGLTDNPVAKDVEAVKAWKKANAPKCKVYVAGGSI
ncbi:MAG: leucine-rich repeat domain-containing protein [Myxococcota bacterium]